MRDDDDDTLNPTEGVVLSLCLLSCLFFFFFVVLFSRERKRQTKRHTQKNTRSHFLFRVTHTYTHTHKKGQKRACFSYYAFFLFRCRHRHREEIVTHYCFDIIVVSRHAARGVSRLLTTTCLCTNAETKKKETAVATNESSGVL